MSKAIYVIATLLFAVAIDCMRRGEWATALALCCIAIIDLAVATKR